MKIEVSPHIANAFVSWKTSLAGLVAFIAINGPQLLAYVQDHKELNGPALWCGLAIFAMGLVARDGDKSSEQSGAKSEAVPSPMLTLTSIPQFHEIKQEDPPKIPPIALLIIAPLLLLFAGCQTTVAVGKSVSDTKTAVAAASTDIQFLATYISDAWAAKETDCATRNYKAALASHAVQATVQVLPNAAAGATATAQTITTVDENIRMAEDANNKRVLAQIEIGRQQLKTTIINRYSANIAVAQALLQGQANYYNTTATTNSTLQTGVDSALAEFAKLAPVIAQAVSKK